MIELKECVRLSARITEASCAKNRASGRIFNCEGCPGLGAASVIEIKEASVSLKQCSVHNCTSLVHARGMCWKHEKSELGINPQNGKPLEKKPAKVKAVAAAKKPWSAPVITKQPVDAPFSPSAQPSEVVLCDMGLELDKLFTTKRREWLEDLAVATTARSRAELFLAMCDSLEGLVH